MLLKVTLSPSCQKKKRKKTDSPAENLPAVLRWCTVWFGNRKVAASQGWINGVPAACYSQLHFRYCELETDHVKPRHVFSCPPFQKLGDCWRNNLLGCSRAVSRNYGSITAASAGLCEEAGRVLVAGWASSSSHSRAGSALTHLHVLLCPWKVSASATLTKKRQPPAQHHDCTATSVMRA